VLRVRPQVLAARSRAVLPPAVAALIIGAQLAPARLHRWLLQGSRATPLLRSVLDQLSANAYHISDAEDQAARCRVAALSMAFART
jgi:hypothetical protein